MLANRTQGCVRSGTKMADFKSFLPTLLRFEGGYVNDLADPGGETNKGITMNTFRGCAQKLLGLAPTAANLRALTDAQAAVIYKEIFWDPIGGDAMPLQELANIVCDFYVNAGTHATTLLQQVLNTLGQAIAVDGKIGPGTLAAVAAVDSKELYRRFKQGRIAYYRNLAARKPAMKKFLKGWLNRVNAFPDL